MTEIEKLAQPLFLSRPVTNAADIIAWAKSQGFAKTMTADKMHVTLSFSKPAVEWDALGVVDKPHTSTGGKRGVEPLGDGGAVVLKFEDPILTARWKGIHAAGAHSDYPSFTPHVTISWDVADMDLSTVQPYEGAIEFGPEIFRTIDDDWKSKVVEKANFSVHAQIAKVDTDQRMVFGIFSVAKSGDDIVVDHEGDRISPEELEKGAYGHVLDARIAGENHIRKGVGDLIESMVFTPEKIDAMEKAFAQTGIIAKIDIPAVAWWGGYYVSDDVVWKAVKDGTYLSFSIGGLADRTAGED